MGKKLTVQAAEPAEQYVDAISDTLLEIPEIEQIIRAEVFSLSDGSVLVAVKISLSLDLTMREVSIVVALAERRLSRLFQGETRVYVTPDVHIDEKNVPSTSAIVTLSYD